MPAENKLDHELLTLIIAIELRLGLLDVLGAIQTGVALPVPGRSVSYHPPPRTQGPIAVAELRKLTAGAPGALEDLSDVELVTELETAWAYEAWVLNPDRWTEFWDLRALSLGKNILSEVLKEVSSNVSTPER